MMVMMSAASSGALMGLATTTHAWTPMMRLPAIQMQKEDRTFERWKQSITRQGNKGGYGQARKGMPQERYASMGDQQGVRRQQGMPQQGYGPMTPRQRIEQQQFMQQQACSSRHAAAGMQQQACSSRHAAAGMQQQQQQAAAAAGMRQQACSSRHAAAGMQQQACSSRHAAAGMRQQGMWQQGNGPMPRQQGPAPTGRRPSSGRWSQAEEKAARRAGMAGNRWAQESFGFPMPPRQRGRVPFGDDWGVAGPSVSQPRTRSSAQALSAVDTDETMNSFAQRGYDQMPKQRGYGQMPMQQEFMPEFDEMLMQPDAFDDMPMEPMEQGFGQMPMEQGFGQMPMEQGFGQMPMEQGFGPMQSSDETYERLSALEEALMGGFSMQGEPPLQRLAFLEAQLLGGTCGGTVLDRLDQLEQAAQESGLL